MGQKNKPSAGGRCFLILSIEGRRPCGQNEITVIRIKRTNHAYGLREYPLHPVITGLGRPIKGNVFPFTE